MAIAAGAWLAGRGTVVMCQNSGLGNAVNPLTSLNAPFRIPTLLIVTWRGQPGLADEPQHELMGQITQPLLSPDAIGSRAVSRAMRLRWMPPWSTRRAEMAAQVAAVRLRHGEGRRGRRRPRRAAPRRACRRRAHRAARARRPPRPRRRPRALARPRAGRRADHRHHGQVRARTVHARRTARSISTRSAPWAAPRRWRSAWRSPRGARTLVLDGDGAALMKLGSHGHHRRLPAGFAAAHPAGQRRARFDRRPGHGFRHAWISPALPWPAATRMRSVCDSLAGFAAAFAQALRQRRSGFVAHAHPPRVVGETWAPDDRAA